MGYVQQSKSGSITVGKDDIIYNDTSENFAKDMGYDAPIILDWADHRIYIQGERHAIHTNNGDRMEGGDMPWEQGDSIIEDIELAIESKELREKVEYEAAIAEHDRVTTQQREEAHAQRVTEQAAALATERTRPKSKDELKQYAARVRYAKQTNGFTSSNYGFILTDIVTTNTITGLVVALEQELVVPPINFKSPMGWISVDAATLKGIAKEIVQYTQNCFNREQELSILIDQGTIKNEDQIDGAFV